MFAVAIYTCTFNRSTTFRYQASEKMYLQMFVPRNSDWGEDQEQKLGSFHFWTDGFSLDMVDSTSNFRSGFR